MRRHDFHRRSFTNGSHPFRPKEKQVASGKPPTNDFRNHESWCLEPREHLGTCQQAMLANRK